MSNPNRNLGALLAVAAAALFGLTAPLSKLFLTGIPAVQASGLLYLSAGLALGAILVGRRWLGNRAVRREASLTLADWPFLAGAVLFGGLAGPILLLFGLKHASGTVASLLLNLEAVFTVLLAVLLGERLERRTWGGVAGIVAGGALLAVDPGQVGNASLWGGLAIAGACLAWGLDNNFTQRLSGRDPLAIVAVKGLLAGPIALALAAWSGAPLPNAVTLWAALGLGASGYGLSLVCFILALRHLGTARTGSLFATAPFLGAAMSLVVLHEAMTPLTWLAGLAMAAGVALMAFETHAHAHAHEALEHDHAHVHDDEHHHHEHPDGSSQEPHAHRHVHSPLVHEHAHHPDLHHRHAHPH